MTVAFDTNILVYAIDHDAGAKHRRARDLLIRAAYAPREALLALQCLGEFVHVAPRKYRLPIADARGIALHWSKTFKIVAAELEDFDRACRAVANHRLGFWDALLCTTLRRAGASWLITEDLQDGRDLEGVAFANPFAAANDGLIDDLLPDPDLG